jgi:uncharacterized protein
MPLNNNSQYESQLDIFKNSYVQTVFAKFFRPVKPINYKRERILTASEHFLDLDWSIVSSNSLVIVIDGLEGNSSRRYTKGAVTAINDNGIDTLAINFRGCSEEKNHEYFLQYGETDDLRHIINYVLAKKHYESIFLVGCSVGGNLITEFLGEEGSKINPRIKKAFVVSATIDLSSSCDQLHIPKNWFFLKAFLFSLMLRVWQMRKTFKRKIKIKEFLMVKTFTDFYYHFVYEQKKVLLHKYFMKNSSYDTLYKVAIPTCMLYAKDDPFLTVESFPYKEAEENSLIELVVTDYGGHVGFVDLKNKYYFSEQLMLDFLNYRIPQVLILCTGNSCRSIMAEACLKHHGKGHFEAYSAGSKPTGEVHPLSLSTLEKQGLETRAYRSKSWDEFKNKQIDIVITVCSSAAEEDCPIFPGSSIKTHWGVEDPAKFNGSATELEAEFSRVYKIIEKRFLDLLKLDLKSLTKEDLKKELDLIGKKYG